MSRALVLEGVTVLTGPDWRGLPDHSVRIEGNRITAVRSAAEMQRDGESRVFDCRGKFLIPGLIDMHTHCHTNAAVPFLSSFGPRLEEPAYRDWFLKLFLAFGVTTVRDVGNYPEIFDLKRMFDDEPTAPSMAVAGELLEGDQPLWPLSRKVTDVAAAKKEIRRQKNLGADWIKLYVGIEPSVSEAVVKEAHRNGLRVAGHIGRTTARQAAKMGIDSLEHALTLVDDEFVPIERRERLPKPTDPKYSRDRMRQVWMGSEFDSEAFRDLLISLKKSNTAVCPTMVVHENTMKGPHQAYQNFAFDFVPQKWIETWDGRFKTFNPEGKISQDSAEAFDKVTDFVSKLISNGVRIIGGTDAALWNPYVVPGASVHREMQHLAAAGLKPKDVLSSFTYLAAETLGRENVVGRIREGFQANLILLRNNPTKDVHNARQIDLVINKGHSFTPEDLLEIGGPVD